jgi:hypothetical protein
MVDYSTSEEFLDAVRSLIDGWCERRCLRALSIILGPYLGFNGLTDGWGLLYDALRSIQASCRERLPQSDLEAINGLIRASEKILYRDRISD